MVRILDADDVRAVVDLGELLDVVAEAFGRQGEGAVERPPRPHFPVGIDLEDGPDIEPAGTGLVMPAYIHGEDHFVTKLAAVHEANTERGLPTVNAQVAVSDAATGQPVAYMDGAFVTAARTSCIGGLSVRELATGSVSVGVIGAGTQARWQVRAIGAATDVESVDFYDVDERATADAVRELSPEFGGRVEAAVDPAAAVGGQDVVVTATTSPDPVFPGEALAPGTLVVAIGAYTPDMQELDVTTFDRAARVFADVPEEVAVIGDIAATELTATDLIPFYGLLDGEAGRENDDEILVVESVGSAIMDAAAAAYVYDRAEEEGLGTEVDL